jgi:hypothetical protein
MVSVALNCLPYKKNIDMARELMRREGKLI